MAYFMKLVARSCHCRSLRLHILKFVSQTQHGYTIFRVDGMNVNSECRIVKMRLSDTQVIIVIISN
jgi:hypothetical protein